MTAALVVGDLQSGITGNHRFASEIVRVVSELVGRARAAHVLVVFIRTELRVNGLDVAPGNAAVVAIHAGSEDYHAGSPGTELDPALGATAADVVVSKRRASGFAGTDLDLVLRAQGVTSVVVTGVATSAMVAATVYDALDRDYRVTVIGDACADPDPRVHEFFVNAVFPRRGVNVVAAESWSPGRAGPVREFGTRRAAPA